MENDDLKKAVALIENGSIDLALPIISGIIKSRIAQKRPNLLDSIDNLTKEMFTKFPKLVLVHL
ncbi:MAG: hypothetical protein HC896_16040 [Bacteroidales bacterium]|nr:hypothetical protein [Bacteroidales bacterium]